MAGCNALAWEHNVRTSKAWIPTLLSMERSCRCWIRSGTFLNPSMPRFSSVLLLLVRINLLEFWTYTSCQPLAHDAARKLDLRQRGVSRRFQGCVATNDSLGESCTRSPQFRIFPSVRLCLFLVSDSIMPSHVAQSHDGQWRSWNARLDGVVLSTLGRYAHHSCIRLRI